MFLAPIAYLSNVFRSAKHLFKGDKGTRESFVFFLFLGLPIMVLAQAADLVYFLIHIYSSNHDYLANNHISAISPEAFNTLEAVVQRELRNMNT